MYFPMIVLSCLSQGEPLVVNAQSADKQNIGDKCLPELECNPDYHYRYFDGRCNNLGHQTWGMLNNTFVRLLPAAYSISSNDPSSFRHSAVDGISPLQNVRVIARDICSDQHSPSTTVSMIFMVIGQLFTHDVLSLKKLSAPADRCCINGTSLVPLEKQDAGCLAFDIPKDDPFYKKYNVVCNQVLRAQTSADLKCELPEIEQVNAVTSYLDGSVIYGNDQDTADELRLMQDGKLKFELIDGRVFLPRMDSPPRQCFAKPNDGGCFQASDFRANQHAQLATLQVMLLRAHNKLAEELKTINADCPEWQDDEILYQETKRILTAVLQYSIFGRYAEILFGPTCADAYGFSERGHEGYYSGYDPELNPGTLSEFIFVAFRAIHTLVKGDIGLYDDNRNRITSFKLSEWYNNPKFVKEPGILDQILIGMCTEPVEMFDRSYTTEVTDKLFKQLRQGKFGNDLAAIDLERGREGGIPPYIEFARLAGYPEVEDFDGLSDRMDSQVIELLKTVYPTVKDIDALVGVLLEKPFGESMFGKTLHAVIAEQMRRYKFGDSFYHSFEGRGQFTPGQLAAIRTSSLSFLICYGSDDIQHMQLDVYSVPESGQLTTCKQIIDDFLTQLNANWKTCPVYQQC